MFWVGAYAVVAVLAAAGIFLLTESRRQPGVAAPDRPGLCAVIAGLLWPVLVLGIAEWGLIAAIQYRLCRTPHDAGDGGRLPLPVSH